MDRDEARVSRRAALRIKNYPEDIGTKITAVAIGYRVDVWFYRNSIPHERLLSLDYRVESREEAKARVEELFSLIRSAPDNKKVEPKRDKTLWDHLIE
jgi:hypothetical protein